MRVPLQHLNTTAARTPLGRPRLFERARVGGSSSGECEHAKPPSHTLSPVRPLLGRGGARRAVAEGRDHVRGAVGRRAVAVQCQEAHLWPKAHVSRSKKIALKRTVLSLVGISEVALG